MIHSQTVAEVYSNKKIPLWLLSAFKAGFINSAGFLITGKFVSHVTGFGTQVGVALGHSEYFFSTELLFIPFAFIMGGVITSFVLDKDYGTGEVPQYWRVQGLITLLLIFIIGLGELVYASKKEFPFDLDGKYDWLELLLISMLCLVCGLKNSLVTWSTFGKIRVTHLTGLSTDIGLNLIRTFNPSQPNPRFKEDRFVNIVRLLTFASFSGGAMLSAMLFPNLGFKGFIIPVLISVGMTLLSIKESYKWRDKFMQA